MRDADYFLDSLSNAPKITVILGAKRSDIFIGANSAKEKSLWQLKPKI